MRTGARPLILALALLLGCNGSRDQLLADLQSPRPEVRALAVKKLAGQGNPDDLVLFTRAAKDFAAIVRAEAAVALGESQDARVVDLLGELLEDQDEEVQGRAAMALSKVNNEKAKAYLTLQYGRRGRATRQVIVQALKNANVPGAMAEVVAAEARAQWDRNQLALTEGALPERVGAAEELGKSGRPDAVNRLLPMVRDSQVILAAAAVRGLGDAGDKRAVAPIALLLEESFPELRESAIHALMKLQDPVATQRLQLVAVEKSAVSPLAIDAIVSFPRTPQTDAALCATVLEGAPAEALAAGRSMRARGGCPLDPIGERLARPATAANGLQAVAGLGPTAQPLIGKVMPWLSHTDAALRLLAVEAVAEIGDASAIPAVQKLYEQEVKGLEALREDWVRQPLPQKFGVGFDPSTMPPPTVPGVKDDRPARHADLLGRVKELNAARVRESGRAVVQHRVPTELYDDVAPERLAPLATLLRALGALKAPGALELLTGYTDDSSSVLRVAALVTLANLGPEGVKVAKAGLIEPDRDLQKALAQALAGAGEVGQAALIELLPKMGSEKLLVLDALTRVSDVPGAAASESLQAVVREGGPEAALAAVLLGRMQAKDSVPTLVKALEEPNSVARRDVLLALGSIGEASAADAVAKDLFHDLPEIRAAAATSLRKLGAAAYADQLDALKGDYFRTVREAAGAAPAPESTASEGAR